MKNVAFGLAAIGLASLPGAAAFAQLSPSAQPECFFVNQFQSWRAPDSKTIYIKVLGERYFRLDVGGSCPELKWPGAYLVTKTRGPDTVCSAVDWDLHVNTGLTGVTHPCIVKSMQALSPSEVAAIPKPFKP